jgi:hypothetical protein
MATLTYTLTQVNAPSCLQGRGYFRVTVCSRNPHAQAGLPNLGSPLMLHLETPHPGHCVDSRPQGSTGNCGWELQSSQEPS